MKVKLIGKKLNSKSGQTMTETIIVTGLIALAGIIAVSFFGSNIKNVWNAMSARLFGTSADVTPQGEGQSSSGQSINDSFATGDDGSFD